jgi:ATP-binding protein involved in chromosome partitioning
MSVRKVDILKALENVIHPEFEKDIVSLEMVQDLEIEGKKVSFALSLKKPNDPFVNSIRNAAINAIRTHVGEDVEVVGNIEVKGNASVIHDGPVPGVKNILAIASGKGGVGKSTISANLAVSLVEAGFRVGLIDADVYGPSVPKMFGVENERPVLEKIDGKDRIIPVEKYGVKLLSIGFFVDQNDALVWRGPMATSALKQLITDGNWGELDYLLIDLPPGTGDIHLTLVQTVPVTGALIVSTPQDVALADAIKGISMFAGKQINVPVLGLVENMAWFTPEELPNNKYYIFGEGGCKKLAEEKGLPLLGQIPIVQGIREGGDSGEPVAIHRDSVISQSFRKLALSVVEQVEKRNTDQAPTEVVRISKK